MFSIEFSQYHKFTEFEFFYEFGLSGHLMYIVFHWIFTILYIVHLMNSNFSMYSDYLSIQCTQFFRWILMISYIQRIWFFNEFRLSIYLIYPIFHWIFTISYIYPIFGLHWKYFNAFVWCFSMSLMHCSRDPRVRISANLTLKLGLTALFTYLKIISLQCFQFSVISSI